MQITCMYMYMYLYMYLYKCAHVHGKSCAQQASTEETTHITTQHNMKILHVPVYK